MAAAASADAAKPSPIEALAVAALHKGPYLVFGGKTGWIGQKMVTLLKERGCEAIAASSRLENRSDVEAEIDSVKPKFVLNCAGVTGRPNVDWCEDHKAETIRVNNFATGCIYKYDDEHTIGGKGFTEEDKPN